MLESTPSGIRVRFTPSEIGDYEIDVTYRNLAIAEGNNILHCIEDPVPGPSHADAEYVVSRTLSPRPDLVEVSGVGLGPIFAQAPTSVIIDTRSAGFGDIDLFVDGPTRTTIHCVDNRDGTLTMNYVPKVAGLYFIRVMFDHEHITGSPFQVVVLPQILLHPEIESPESSFSGSSSHRTTPVV